MAAVLRLIGLRLLGSAVVLFLVATFIYWSTNVGVGDTATRLLGREATPQMVAVLRAHLHLDEPFPVRYLRWLGGVLRLDFGQSIASQRSVIAIIGPRLRNSLLLAAGGFLLYLPVTIIGAVLSAVRRGKLADHLVSLIALVLGLSLPEFVLGTALLVFFVLVIPIAPVVSGIDTASSAADYLRALALPSVVVATSMSAYGIRMLRANLIEVLESDYVRMATLKGMPRHRVILRHALPNALLPFLNVTALNLTYLFGGVIIVEIVFGYPGIGSLLVEAISLRDGPLIAATALIPSAVYIAANLFADVAAILLTPKLRMS